MKELIAGVAGMVWLASCSLVEKSAEANTIQPQDFSPAAIVETFEGIAPLPNPYSWRFPTPYTLPSGATLAEPYPNRTDTSATFLVDGGGFFGYTFANILPYIPSGTAYLGQSAAGAFDDGVVFTFPSDMLRVGAYVVADPWHHADGLVLVTTYDASGNVLDSLSFSHAAVTGWKSHFIGFENPTGIRSVRFKGDGDAVLRLDNLTFEAVPEPPTLILLGVGTIGLLGYGWRRVGRNMKGGVK